MSDIDIGLARGIASEVVYRLRTELGEAPESIRAMPKHALVRAILKLEQPDRALRRVEHELGALRDDTGELGEGATMRALQQVADTQNRTPVSTTSGLPVGSRHLPLTGPEVDSTAGLSGATGWTEIGPDNIGGRTRAIVVDPSDSSRIYAAAAGGGVWRSSDAGASWNPTGDMMGNLAVCSLAISPSDPSVIYAGTGEGFTNADAIRGDGIFVTTDAASTWTSLASTASDSRFHYVNSIAVSPDAKTLLAGTKAGIFRSADDGANWTQTSALRIGNITFDPTNPRRAIAGTLRSLGVVGTALFTLDKGKTWETASVPTRRTGRVQVCYAFADPTITYASVDVNPAEIWRSVDGGQSYAQMGANSGGSPARYLAQQGWYDNTIWAGDPMDSDLVIVGGIDLWRSTDGGDTLIQISTWWSPLSAHADHHVIVSDPDYNGTTNRRVYFGNDGGVYRVDDISTVGNNASPPYDKGWAHLNNGYAVTQFFYGASHIGTNSIIGGTQDNGTLRYTPSGGKTWNKLYGGDGGACASDPSDSQIWYGEYVYASVFRNTDGGATDSASRYISGLHWTGSEWIWKPEPYTIPDARASNAEFIAPFVLDPNDSNRLIVGGTLLWLSTDPTTPNTPTSGPSWRSIKPRVAYGRSNLITSIAVADGNSDVIMVGHGNGNVYRSTDGTAAAPTWTQVDTNGIGANRQCLGLCIQPDDHETVYATFGGYQAGNVWKTEDGGASWSEVSAGLPDAPVRAVTVHPQRGDWVYLATEVGVFGSDNGGLTWSATNEGPAKVACRDLFWLGCELVVATHGRGMFKVDVTIARAFPDPDLSFVASEDYQVNGQNFTRYRLEILNFRDYPSSLFRPSPDLPPCGLTAAAARTWVDIIDGDTDQRIYGFCALDSNDDLQSIWFAVPRGTRPPASVYVVLRDRRCNQTYQSNEVTFASATSPVQERRITMVDNIDGAIVRVAGPWGVADIDEVIASVESGAATYFIDSVGVIAKVSVVRGRTGKYLRSYGDATIGNNLDELPPVT